MLKDANLIYVMCNSLQKYDEPNLATLHFFLPENKDLSLFY